MSVVSIEGCSSYDEQEIKKSIDRTFENLGGIDRFVKKGDRVFLKINLVIKKKPEVAATTHPAVVEAVARKLVEAGAEVIIGDSPGGPYDKPVLQSIYRVCGIEKAAERAGAKLNFDCTSMEYHHPGGVAVKMLTLTKPLMDCDRIITISKLKTHGMVRYSGAVKVMFGAIPGVLKAEYHLKMGNIRNFSNMLVDICTLTKPCLSIIDGVTGMEGDGPTAGSPVQSNVILASESPYDLDVIGAYLIGIKPESVPTVQRSVERGLTTGKVRDITIAGGSVDKYRKSYKMPPIRTENFSEKVPAFVERFVKRRIMQRPVFSQEVCIGCGTCRNSCPPGAIEMKNGRPTVDVYKCIRCFCCQELCPQKAVSIRRPWDIKRLK